MQEDKEPLFDAFHQTSGSLAMAAVVADSVVLYPAKPAAAAEESWVVATDLAEELARRRSCLSSGPPDGRQTGAREHEERQRAIGMDGESLVAFAPEFTPEMARLLNPVEGMKSRALPGGTAPAAVARWRWRKRPATGNLSPRHGPDEQELPSGPDPEDHSRQGDLHAGGTGA